MSLSSIKLIFLIIFTITLVMTKSSNSNQVNDKPKKNKKYLFLNSNDKIDEINDYQEDNQQKSMVNFYDSLNREKIDEIEFQENLIQEAKNILYTRLSKNDSNQIDYLSQQFNGDFEDFLKFIEIKDKEFDSKSKKKIPPIKKQPTISKGPQRKVYLEDLLEKPPEELNRLHKYCNLKKEFTQIYVDADCGYVKVKIAICKGFCYSADNLLEENPFSNSNYKSTCTQTKPHKRKLLVHCKNGFKRRIIVKEADQCSCSTAFK